jgi:diguanylate cyclase (GGDEF)-like protein
VDRKIEERLKGPISFPSPPGVAQQIILLANDPDVQMAALSETLSKDPGLAAKVLRIANSALYARRRRSENLRQALTVLGLGAATTLALSFSLAPLFRKSDMRGLDYSRCWRRALLGAIASRTLGEHHEMKRTEELFLAGLMQDLGMLALDRTDKQFYAELPVQASHEDICRYEEDRLGVDHAAVGGRLLKHWQLSEFLCRSIELSHTPEISDGSIESGQFTRCVALASHVADFLLAENWIVGMGPLEGRAQDLLCMDRKETCEVIATIVDLLPEIERLFESELLDAAARQTLLDQARELLAVRSLESLERVSRLEEKTDALERRTETLEDENRRDPLTGVFNRRYLEARLSAELSSAIAGKWPLSVIFIDLDHFKQVNDTHGHPAGDAVLRSTARVLVQLVRSGDVVARYGGEEFVMVLPGVNADASRALCARIVEALRQTSHHVAKESITVTASVGLAVHSERAGFASVDEIVKAADEALYLAKSTGRDRWCYVHRREALRRSG